LLLDFVEQEFAELVKDGLDIDTPNGVQHFTFELYSCADAKFLALLQRQIANNNARFSLVSPDIITASKTNPHLKIGEAAGDARPYTHQLHLVILHLFRRIQRILQIACSTTVSHMFMREPATLTCSLTDDNREAGRAPTAMHRAAAWCGAVLAQLRHQPIDHPYEHRGQCEAGSKQRH
jgi:hypothetical protein